MSETYHELVVEGPPLWIKGFVAGISVARGLEPDAVLIADDLGVQTESFLEQIAEWIRVHRPILHLLVPQVLLGDVRQALERVKSSMGIDLKSDRAVRSASFRFTYTAYNKRLAEELDALLKSFPGEVHLSDDYRPQAKVDPAAEGVEAYSPAHDFELTASGTATGCLSAILSLHRKAQTHSLMRVERIQLHHPDD